MKSLRSRDLRVWERIALAKKLVVPQFFEMMRTPSSVLVIWWADVMRIGQRSSRWTVRPESRAVCG
jgi:hypothetical protein